MLKHYGLIDYDFEPLIKEVQAIKDWIYRLDPESETTCVVRQGHKEFPEEIINLIDKAQKQFLEPGYSNRIVLSCVPAGKEILPHTDDFGADIENASLHCHIPLITSENIILGFDDEAFHLEQGHLYTMDVTKRHYVVNPTQVDRIHLLFAHFPH